MPTLSMTTPGEIARMVTIVFAPIVRDEILVIEPVPFLLISLAQIAIVAEHRLAVTRPDPDASLLRLSDILRAGRKLITALMHCGPNEIETVAFHHIVDDGVGVYADAFCLAEAFLRPRPEIPVLIIHEYTAKLDRLSPICFAKQCDYACRE